MTFQYLVVYTDAGSVDIDDFIALMLMRKHALEHTKTHRYIVVATGHYALQRARMIYAFLGLNDDANIQVVVGYEPQSSAAFQELYPAFPELFGRVLFDGDVLEPGQKQWYPNFGKAFESLVQETPHRYAGHEVVEQLFAEQKNVVVCILCPPTDFASVADKLHSSCKVFCMGGESAEGKPGYNWGICPGACEAMFAGLDQSCVPLFVVDGAQVRSLKISLELDLYNEWENSADKSEIQAAFMREFQNSMNGNVLTDGKLLCDPVTMAVALNACTPLEKVPLDVSIVKYVFGPRTSNYLQMKLKHHSAEENLSEKNAYIIERSLLFFRAQLHEKMRDAWKIL